MSLQIWTGLFTASEYSHAFQYINKVITDIENISTIFNQFSKYHI